MDTINLAIILLSIVTFIYGYFKYSFGYWKSRGVPHDEPSIPYGNIKADGIVHSNYEIIKRMYDKYKPTGVKVCGFYHFFRPVAIILDLDLIKKIFIKDCNKFADQNVYRSEMDEIISAHSSFALDGERWQKLCTTELVPAFSSDKIKTVFPSFVQVGERLRDCLHDVIDKQPVAEQMDGFEIEEWCRRFMIDGVACVFGIEFNALKDENVKFQEMGLDEMSEFITKTVTEAIDNRESKKIQRDDLLDVLLKLKNDEDKETAFTLDEIVSQTFAFFEAGFNSSATILTFCLYELAVQFDIQSRARKVINEALTKCNGRCTYEMVMDLPFIDQIIEEILRLYSGAGYLERDVKKDYPIPGTNIVLKKGTNITVPLRSIHNDPEYYPEPELFNPDRFEEYKDLKRDLMTWLPFGSGPRNCIGMRFAMIQIKIGLVQILKHFVISLGAKTTLPLEISKNKTIYQPQDGIHLKFRPLKP